MRLGARVTSFVIVVQCFGVMSSGAEANSGDDSAQNKEDEQDDDEWEELPEFGEDEIDCPQHGDRYLIDVHVPWGTALRAFLTMPTALRAGPSAIPGAGLGVFAKTFISRYTWLGEYDGEVIPDKVFSTSDYAWRVARGDDTLYYIDAVNIATSNWMRFVNCARNTAELNVDVYSCRGKIYYMSRVDLYPGTELLVYYGDEYAKSLGIDVRKFSKIF